jgi:transcriptional regulator with XRE-family HTH domain
MFDQRLLVAARVLAGWSQQELATAAGVGLNTVLGLETGNRDTRTSSLQRILNALLTRGVEVTLGSERWAYGVQIVRGGLADRSRDLGTDETAISDLQA